VNELAELLDQTRHFLTRYVVFATPEQAEACALWVGHTWLYDQFDIAPYLWLRSAEKRSAKTLLQDCLELVVREPLATSGASLAAIFRAVNEWHPTLLLDEVDAIFNRKNGDASEDLRGLLNSGYRRGRPYLRIVGEGRKMRVEKFDTYSPKCIASIGGLPDTIADRSIMVILRRRLTSEPIERWRSRRAFELAQPIKEWWEFLAQKLALPEHADVPPELSDRAIDSWEPLLAIAEAAGGGWLDRGRRAALVLSGVVAVDEERAGIRLLGDIRSAFEQRGIDRVSSKVLLGVLNSDTYEESGWSEWRGHPLTGHGLGYLLHDFGIRSKPVKISGETVKGFTLDQFADAFARYLPPSIHGSLIGYSVTTERESERGSNQVTDQEPLTGETQPTVTKGNGSPYHTCHGCHQPILDLAAGFLDARSMTFWHRDHWEQRLNPSGGALQLEVPA